MKKLLNHTRSPFPLFKLNLKMKLSILLIFLALFAMKANDGYGQNTKVTLQLNNVTIGQVIDKIEGTTELEFVYIIDDVDLKRKISVQAENELISVLLDRIFSNTKTTYNLNGQRVYLVKRPNFKSQKNPVTLQPKKIQQNAVSGKVTDENGDPLPGANIIEKGTTNGQITDFDGNYTIAISNSNAVLQVSYLGYVTKEINVNNQAVVNISLLPDEARLEEVVVIGYGSLSKGKVLGSIAKVNTETINRYASPSFEQTLAGTMPGINISQGGRDPFDDAVVNIRGIGSFGAGQKPLIVVDGVPLSEDSSLGSLNTNDILSISVLKDAASASIYGSRAANGVILISTKKGTNEELQVSFKAFSGVQFGKPNIKPVDAYDAALFFKEARDRGYVTAMAANGVTVSENDDVATRLANGAGKRQLRLAYTEDYLNGVQGLTNTNWIDEVYKTSFLNNYHLSLAQAMDKTNFYTSIGYETKDGVTIGSDLEKITSNITVSTQVSERLKFNLNLNTSYAEGNVTGHNNGHNTFPADPNGGWDIMYPFFPVRNDDGSFAIGNQLYANTPEDGALAENVVAMTELSDNTVERFRTIASATLEYNIIEDLTAKGVVGTDYRNNLSKYFRPSGIGQYRTLPENAIITATENRNTSKNLLTEFTLNYNTNFNKHNVNVIGGYSFQTESFSRTNTNANDFENDLLRNISGGSTWTVDNDESTWAQVSYFGRLQYDFSNKYLASASIRTDGSSRFGDDTKWGVFPSASVGWLLSEEDFFPEDSFINNTKLRASWGQVGNNQIGNYDSQGIINVDEYTVDGQLVVGNSTGSSPNAGLSWETSTSTNLGLDLGFFNNKIAISTEYYNTETEGVLLNVPVPQQSGFNSSLQNIGAFKNSGFEIDLRGNGFNLGEVSIGFNANFSTNKNEVLELGPDQEEIIESGGPSFFRTKIGGPIAELYVYKSLGVYKTQAEIDSSPSLDGTVTGDYWIADTNNDGEITDDDRVGVGTYNPDFTYAFGANLQYRNFDFNFLFDGVEGRSVSSYTFAAIGSGEAFKTASQYYFDNRYHPENNPDGFMSQPNTNRSQARRAIGDRIDTMIQDGDYLRLRTLQLGYNFSPKDLKSIGLSNLRLYLTGNNLFTLTNFVGVNSEGGSTGSSSVLRQGYVRGTGPVQTSIIAGLNITF